jgi:hypothetical protein
MAQPTLTERIKWAAKTTRIWLKNWKSLGKGLQVYAHIDSECVYKSRLIVVIVKPPAWLIETTISLINLDLLTTQSVNV